MPRLKKEILLLRTLKGAPMSILFAFQIINQPLDIPLLSLATGYSVDEILTALLTLREMGVVMEHPGGRWTERLVFTDPDFLHPPNLISIN